ncbi:MAG: phosphatase PAP2 family protein [Pseudomonadota bacterium]
MALPAAHDGQAALGEVPDVGGDDAVRKLNARHRNILLVQALTAGLDTQVTPNGSVEVRRDGNQIAVLTSPFANGANAAAVASQLQPVIDRRWLRQERMNEILEQQTDLISFLSLVHPISAVTHPMLMVLLDAVHAATVQIEVAAKHGLSVIRPGALSAAVNPVIQTPSHSACPSGHATEAFALAFTLEALIFGQANQDLRLIAARIEENRIVAGVHFEHDGYMGRRLAAALAAVFAQRMGVASTAPAQADIWSEPGENGVFASNQDGTPGLSPQQVQVNQPNGGSAILASVVKMAKLELGN